MHYRYSPSVLTSFPQMQSRGLLIDGINRNADPNAAMSQLTAIAENRLALATEGEFPEIKAWRRAFSAMGYKPTQYRCASEALLRRFRMEGSLPVLHPLVDLCNATSLAFAIPVAVFDVEKINGILSIRHADGDEIYETFGGNMESPEQGEIIYADDDRRAHARRWTNRQSGCSAINSETKTALIVTEALHETAQQDTDKLINSLMTTLKQLWPASKITRVNPA
ncbi:B3/B4 domain-containing protein [Pseudochrobactrum lubricantis]|uniref:B3/B4 domain-containing protein n=1 Tax=Pseudochrobactrum lubricantis TaxID=558172 RepID=UPI0035DCBE54